MSDDNQDAADDDENSLKRTFPRPRPGTFNKECPEYSLLLEMLRAGKFSRGATPKAIWESRPEFQRFTLSKFRYGLRFAKSEAGFHVRPADDGPALAKRKRVATGTEDDCKEKAGSEDFSGKPARSDPNESDLVLDSSKFCPMNCVVQYNDTTTKTPHAVVLIVPPAGINDHNSSRSTFTVVDDGMALEYTSDWPIISMELEEVLNKKIEKMTEDGNRLMEATRGYSAASRHDQLMRYEHLWADTRDMIKIADAFSNEIASMKSSESEILTSSCKIPLPIKVSKKIEKPPHLLGTPKSSERVILVDLKGEESTYKETDTARLELVDMESSDDEALFSRP